MAKVLYVKPGEAPELIDVDEVEDALGEINDYYWPWKFQETCIIEKYDREDLELNRILVDEHFRMIMELRGPFVVAADAELVEDLSEEDATRIGAMLRFPFSKQDKPFNLRPLPFRRRAYWAHPLLANRQRKTDF